MSPLAPRSPDSKASPTMDAPPPQQTIRAAIVQPALPKYRIPVFQELARRPGIELRVCYGKRGDLPNVEAEGFPAEATAMWRPTLLGQHALWHPAQYTEAVAKKCDVVVLNWTPRYLTLLPALLRAKRQGVATVLWGHGYSKKERAWWRGIRRSTGSLADCLLFYDEQTAKQYLEEGWSPEQVFVAPNALDQAPIESARSWWLGEPGGLEEFRRREGAPEGPFVLFVSRLHADNRLDLLVQALAEPALRARRVTAVIIGNGPEERARISAFAGQLGVHDQVLFRDGLYEEKLLAPWFLTATAFCYPQNIGLSLLHSFGYGLPVITSDNRACQNPEIAAFESGVNGLAYQHGSAKDMARAILELIDEPDLRDRLGEEALRTARQRFTIPRMVDGIEIAMRSALHRSRR
ncbi:MAG: glycosyltransferase family 4 protein [Planctomycetales bacterium]|nr:glycosyltransferase family 4 protein [Planctomycetales bacterium]